MDEVLADLLNPRQNGHLARANSNITTSNPFAEQEMKKHSLLHDNQTKAAFNYFPHLRDFAENVLNYHHYSQRQHQTIEFFRTNQVKIQSFLSM